MSQKNSGISLIRLIATLCIVACHICQYLDAEAAWWLNVGVQIFLCMSGYLYANKEIETFDFLKKNFKKVLSGYYTVLIPFALVGLFVLKSCDLKTVFHAILTFGTVPGGEHLWYIPVILCCYFLTPFLCSFFNRFEGKRVHIAFVGIMLAVNITFELFVPYFNPAWISCYVMGYYLGRIGENRAVNSVIFTLCLVTNGAQIVSDYVHYFKIPHYWRFTNYAHAFLGVGLFIVLKWAFKGIKRCKILDISDKYSYFVYLTHQFFILGPLTLMELTEHLWLNITVILLATAVSATVFKYITDKIYMIFGREKEK